MIQTVRCEHTHPLRLSADDPHCRASEREGISNDEKDYHGGHEDNHVLDHHEISALFSDLSLLHHGQTDCHQEHVDRRTYSPGCRYRLSDT